MKKKNEKNFFFQFLRKKFRILRKSIFLIKQNRAESLTDFMELCRNLGNKTNPNITPNAKTKILNNINVFGFCTNIVTVIGLIILKNSEVIVVAF